MSRAALWQAIIENPEDRTVRLIYADWLEEHSDEPDDLARAELIRAQISLERLPRRSRKGTPARQRVRELLRENKARWTKGLPSFASEPEFRGGFLEHVRAGATKFAEEGNALLEAFPTVTSVQFFRAANEIRALLSGSVLPRLRRVDLSSMCVCGICEINAQIREFLSSPQLTNLTHLSLAGNRLEDATVQALVETPFLGSLRWLDLQNNPLTQTGSIRTVIRLFRAAWFSQLEHLDLRGIPLSQGLRGALQRRLEGRVMLSKTG